MQMMKRFQRLRTKGAKLPVGTLVVTRPTIWGNPWVGPDAVMAYRLFCEGLLEGVLHLSTFESVLNVKRVFDKPITEWKQLRGLMLAYCRERQDVACYCGPTEACHGNVILALPYLRAWQRAIEAKVLPGGRY